MKLIIDMNLSPRWVERLAQSQIPSAHWSTLGNPEALDSEIMAYAVAHDYVVLTNDLDFSAILAVTHGAKPSVVQIRSENLDPDFIGPQVTSAIQQVKDELLAGALVNVEPTKTRLRLLPLNRPKD